MKDFLYIMIGLAIVMVAIFIPIYLIKIRNSIDNVAELLEIMIFDDYEE